MSGDFEGILETAGAAAVEAAVLAGQKRTHCPNCGAEFGGPYCAHCGQERDTHRRTIATLLGDFFEDILSFDSRILRTARALVSQPGELSCAFRGGRTQAYVPPIRLYFFVTLLFFLILSVSGIAILKLDVVPKHLSAAEIAKVQAKVNAQLTGANKELAKAGQSQIRIDFAGGGKDQTYLTTQLHFFAPIDTKPQPISPEVQKVLDNVKAEMAKADKLTKNNKTGDWISQRVFGALTLLAHDPTAINGPLTTWIPRALFLLLPIFAGLLALLNWRQRKHYYFVDHLVFSLNVHSFAFVVLIAAVWLAQVVSGGTVGWFTLAACCLYLLFAMKKFYGQSWIWTGIKFVSLSFIYAVFFLIPALATVVVISVFEA